MPEKLARLTEIGFMRAGEWKLGNGTLLLELENDFSRLQNVLYAFAVDGSLAYVGKTAIALRDRLQRYKTPAKNGKSGGSTNIKNHQKILDNLSRGSSVEIYVLHKKETVDHGGFVLNFAASLEDSVLAELKPPWNGRQHARVSGPLPALPLDGSNARVALRGSSQRPKVTDFRDALALLFSEASSAGLSYVEVQAGALHRRVGGYPAVNHAMPVCCDAMRSVMEAGDIVLSEPPKGKGASLTIRYGLPRTAPTT